MGSKINLILNIRKEGQEFATEVASILNDDNLNEIKIDLNCTMEQLLNQFKEIPLALLKEAYEQVDDLFYEEPCSEEIEGNDECEYEDEDEDEYEDKE